MAKLERAKYQGNKIKKATSTDVVIPKRKIQSIRPRYYATTPCSMGFVERFLL
jgi:hypothetical protein